MEQQHPGNLPLNQPSVIATLLTELAMLYAQGLALGQNEPLDILGLQRPPHFQTATREWGVGGLDAHHCALVISNQGDVDWKLFPQCLPLAHSHPIDAGFVNAGAGAGLLNHDVGFNQGIDLLALIGELIQLPSPVVDFSAALTRIVPSNQDVRANYRLSADHAIEEVLFLPYRYHVANGTLSLGANDPGLMVHFGPVLGIPKAIPQQIGSYSDIVTSFIAPIRISHGIPKAPVQIWTGWLQCGWGDQGGMTLSAGQPASFGAARTRTAIEDAVKQAGVQIPVSALP
jgi:hypothetical protein